MEKKITFQETCRLHLSKKLIHLIYKIDDTVINSAINFETLFQYLKIASTRTNSNEVLYELKPSYDFLLFLQLENGERGGKRTGSEMLGSAFVFLKVIWISHKTAAVIFSIRTRGNLIDLARNPLQYSFIFQIIPIIKCTPSLVKKKTERGRKRQKWGHKGP